MLTLKSLGYTSCFSPNEWLSLNINVFQNHPLLKYIIKLVHEIEEVGTYLNAYLLKGGERVHYDPIFGQTYLFTVGLQYSLLNGCYGPIK